MTALQNTQPNSGFDDIIEQQFEEASFLWMLRDVAVNQPQYTHKELKKLEKRIEQHLDALIVHPEQTWQIIEKKEGSLEPSEVFVMAVIAFRGLDVKKIQMAVEAGLTDDKTFKALTSALGWISEKISLGWMKKFVQSKSLDHKYLAIAAYSILRVDPGEMLSALFTRDDCIAHKKLYVRGLRLIGELKRRDLVSELNQAMESEDPDIIFWSNWSALLLGNRAALAPLRSFAMSPGIYQQRAIDIAFRVLSTEDARQWISELSQDAGQERSVLKAIAALGDPHAIGWVVAKMKEPPLTRLAGETFTIITGIDLCQNQLAIEVPNLDEILSLDEELEVQDIQEDENLPWPNSEKVAAVWQQYGQQFIPGRRYFMGHALDKPIELLDSLEKILESGGQRYRHASALHVALLQPNQILINTRERYQIGIALGEAG